MTTVDDLRIRTSEYRTLVAHQFESQRRLMTVSVAARCLLSLWSKATLAFIAKSYDLAHGIRGSTNAQICSARVAVLAA